MTLGCDSRGRNDVRGRGLEHLQRRLQTQRAAARALTGIVKLTKSSSIDPQDTGLQPVVNPPCWASKTAVSFNLTIPTERMQSRVHPTYQTKYRVANWAAYDRALVGRGDVTLWLAPEALDAWAPGRVGTRGGQFKYSDLAIETALTLRLIFHLPLRQAEGFLNSLFGMMGIDRSAAARDAR